MSIDVVNDGDPYMNAMNTVDLMDKRLADIQGLQFQEDYQQALASGQNPLPSYASPTFAAPAPAPQAAPANPMAGWASSPEQGGLGLAAQPSQAQGQPQGQDFGNYLAQQMYPGANLNGFQKWRLQWNALNPGAVQSQLQQRQQLAQQLAQQEEARRQNQWEDVFKILGNDKLSPPQAMTMLKQLSKSNPHAAVAAKSVNDKMIGEFHTLRDQLPMAPEQYAQGLMKGEITWDAVAADLGVAREEQKTLAKDNAQQRKVQGLISKFQQNPDSLTPTELDLVDKFYKDQEDRKLKVQELSQKVKHNQVMNPLQEQKERVEIGRGKAPIVSQPFYNQAGETQNMITDPVTGQQRQVGGVPFSRSQQQIMPAGMQTQRTEVLSSMAILKDAANMYHPDFVGKADTFWNAVGRTLGVETTRKLKGADGQVKEVKETEFRTAYDALIKLLRKESMGTAQSVQEISTNPLAYPSATDMDADKTVPSFMKNQFQSLVRKLEAQNQVLSEQRRANPVAASQRMKQLMDMAQAKDAKGNNALGFKNANEMNHAIAERLAEEVQNGWVIPDIPATRR